MLTVPAFTPVGEPRELFRGSLDPAVMLDAGYPGKGGHNEFQVIWRQKTTFRRQYRPCSWPNAGKSGNLTVIEITLYNQVPDAP